MGSMLAGMMASSSMMPAASKMSQDGGGVGSDAYGGDAYDGDASIQLTACSQKRRPRTAARQVLPARERTLIGSVVGKAWSQQLLTLSDWLTYSCAHLRSSQFGPVNPVPPVCPIGLSVPDMG
ncbi:unnamed protein product [Rhizoctonia solani]|uniref:Uncharacterized protein n=1 Tax=Rhizoctonia solani TaxID=456999 RepID=A0A8H3GWW3_9AGAM|nr:unnamed protein product [Rhizoctonia solani]